MNFQDKKLTAHLPSHNIIEFRVPVILRMLFFFGTIFFAFLLFLGEDNFYLDLIFGGLAILLAVIFIYFGFRFQFDNNYIYYRNGLGKKTQVAWNEIDHIKGETLLSSLRAFDSTGKKIISIPSNTEAYTYFTDRIRAIRPEFFKFKMPITFKRRLWAEVILSSIAIYNGLISIASYQESPDLFAVIWGGFSVGCLVWAWLTPIHKVVITNDHLIISSRGKKLYEIEPNSIRNISLQSVGEFYLVSIISDNLKEIKLLTFDVGSSILYNNLMAWWRERKEPYDSYGNI